MVKKLLQGFLILLLLLVLGLAGGLWYLNAWLNSHEEKLLHELTATAGLEVAFRRVDLRAWETFPRVSMSVDSLVVRDSLLPRDAPALVAVRKLRGAISLDALLHDTLRVLAVELHEGSIHLETDSTGRTNAGELFRADSTSAAPAASALILDYDGLDVQLSEIDFTFINPLKRKRIVAALHSLDATGHRAADGGIDLATDLDLHVGTLTFNTDKGGYLDDTPVSGHLDVHFGAETWTVAPTPLAIGDQTFHVGATIDRREGGMSQITLENPATDFAQSRGMLHDKLQAKLSEYDIRGRFPVRAEINSSFERGENPEVHIAFRFAGQDVQLKQYLFRDAHAVGTFVNRLDEADGGTPGSRKNLRFDFDSVRAYQQGLYVEMPHALLYANEYDTRLRAPVRVSGSAETVSQRLGNESFLFERGRFVFTTQADASLVAPLPAILDRTDGLLRFTDLDVVYRPAGVRFPFAYIEVGKTGEDVRFHIQSSPLPTGVAPELVGSVDNLTPLVFNRPGQAVRTDVTLLAPRIDWTDFRAFFGQDGYFTQQEPGAGPPVPPQSSEAERSQAIKSALLGIQRTFHPNLDVRLDTVAYYDVFTLTDLRTGLHFDRDTLVLERTSFDWAGSEVAFGARLDLAEAGRTPFALELMTEHLDVNALGPTIDHFGPALPPELDRLPDDLHIDFAHRGVIDDTFGIAPGYNSGRLSFDDGRAGMFTGELDYDTTGTERLHSTLHLAGDPQLVNELFRAKNFFFSSGSFGIELELDGTPASVPELLENGKLALRIDSSRISYPPAGVYIPVRHFAVDVAEERATYELQLMSDATRRAVELSGELDRLSGFIYPELDVPFAIRTDLTATELHWSDLRDFIRPDTTGRAEARAERRAAAAADTTDFDPQQLLSATGGIFSSLRPDLSVAIDTFYLGRETPFVDLHAGMHLRDSTQLVVEQSGFRLGAGTVELAATYDLDERVHSAFTVDFTTDSLSLHRLLEELGQLDSVRADDLGLLRGTVSLDGHLVGQLDESRQRPLIDSTRGTVAFRLTGLELADWPFLTSMGKKARMRKRFRHLRFAPLVGEVRIDSGRLVLPRTEVQSTGIQVFAEGEYDDAGGADFLISVPLRNIGRGVMEEPPRPTGYERAGWKVYLVARHDEEGELKMKFRLGRRKYFKRRGRLEEWRAERRARR